MSRELLDKLADRAGIAASYRDTWGKEHDTSTATLRAVLRAMRLPADTQRETVSSLAQLDFFAQQSTHRLDTATQAWLPPALAGDGRRWGLAVQLYALRAAHSWGIGDFTALAELMEGAAKLGACAVGINPLHALFPTCPEHASPYSPSSRRFLNPLYLDVEAIDDFALCEAAHATIASDPFQSSLQAARAAEQVQYERVALMKFQVLAMLYKHFRNTCLRAGDHPRARAFRGFRAQYGRHLRTFATFNALAQELCEVDWHQWPADLQCPHSNAVTEFAAWHVDAIGFHEYLQWQATEQLEHASEVARAAGMSVGLFTDLAVGADPRGAECWADQPFLATEASIGAPPDALNLDGQNWGLPPPDPLALPRAGYAPMAELWEANMHAAGALRIDHILGLMRLYWIPSGASATDGAYVRYGWHDLLGLLAAQSCGNHCMVIGEDLGTVPEGLRDALREARILAYRLLVFEQHNGHFRPPREYPAAALVAAGTHDLPPLAMWWSGEDIELRDRLGLWPDAQTRDGERAARDDARHALIAALRQEKLHADGIPDEAPIEAIYAYLARTPSKLLMVQPEDVLGLHTQVNVPGTTTEHANWRQRLPCSVGELLTHPRLQRIATRLRTEGRADS